MLMLILTACSAEPPAETTTEPAAADDVHTDADLIGADLDNQRSYKDYPQPLFPLPLISVIVRVRAA